jgi:hypothetical protein
VNYSSYRFGDIRDSNGAGSTQFIGRWAGVKGKNEEGLNMSTSILVGYATH